MYDVPRLSEETENARATKITTMTNPTIDPPQENFPDELLDRIIAKTEEMYEKIPIDKLAKFTQEQIGASIKCTADTMIIGAKLALDYIKEKMN